MEAIRVWEGPRELFPDEGYESDPAAAFGIIEARRHRQRGIDFAMFLGFMKYYRRAYVDLCHQLGWPASDTDIAHAYVDRFFDRIEVGFCSEWVRQPVEAPLAELQDANRRMTNEKNKYLTLFESAAVPMFFFDTDNQPSALNQAAARFVEQAERTGPAYYGSEGKPFGLPWLQTEVSLFVEARNAERRKSSLARALGITTSDSRRCSM